MLSTLDRCGFKEKPLIHTDSFQMELNPSALHSSSLSLLTQRVFALPPPSLLFPTTQTPAIPVLL